MDRRTRSLPPPGGEERRRGDRRRGQAAVLDHRRAQDRRLGEAGADLVLQQRAFVRQLAAPPPPRPATPPAPAVPRVVDLRDAEPDVELVRCPLCDVLHDRLWLFRHVARDH